MASGIGIQRSLYCLKDAELFCTPVDTSVRGIISSTWRKVLCEPKYFSCQFKHFFFLNKQLFFLLNICRYELSIYNCSNGTSSIRKIMAVSYEYIETAPLLNTVWAPTDIATTWIFLDCFYAIFLHFLPALLMDFVATHFLNQKPM